jgi:zinc protease
MKTKLTFFIVALMVLSACNVLREKTREGLYGESDYGSMQPIARITKYQTPPLQEIPLSKNVVKGTLPNGLTYYIYKTDRGGYENSAYFQLIQKSGSLVEDDDQLGVAHFVEHYAYNWTQNFPNCAAPDFVKKIGGITNASTSYDYTEYYIDRVALKDNATNIDTCLLILRDIAANCDFEGGLLDRERKIILEEYRMRNSTMVYNKVGEITRGTRYADRPVIGTLESINQMTLQKLKDYYLKWYQPQNQAVLVYGNVNVSEIEGKIAKFFGDIPRGSNEIPVYPFTRTKHTAPDIITIKDDKNEKGSFEIFFNMPNKSLLRQRNTVAFYLEFDMRWRLKQFIEDRLKRIKRETMLFDNVEVISDIEYYQALDDIPFIIRVDFAPENWQKAVVAVEQELEKIRRYGWTKKEINAHFHDLNYSKSLNDSVDFSKGRNNNLGNAHLQDTYVGNFVYGNYIVDDKIWEALIDYRSGRIDAGMAHDYFTKMIADSNTVAVLTLPGGADQKEALSVYLAARNSVDDKTAYKYAENPNYQRFIKELQVNVNQPGKTVSQRKIKEFDATEFTFENGVKAVVSTKDCPKFFFQILGIRPGMLTNFSDEDAQKIKMLNNVRATPYMSINNDRIHTMFSVSDNLDDYLCYSDLTGIPPEPWLRYMYYLLTNNEIDTLRLNNCKLKFAIDSKTEKPLMSRWDELFTKSYLDAAYEKRCAPLSPQIIENITVDEMRDLYNRYYSNFNGSVFIINSEYSPSYLKPFLEKYLGSLPTQPQPVQPADIKAYKYKDYNDTTYYHYKAEEPRADVVINYVLKDNFQYSEERHIVSDAFVTILNDLLFNNIRQTDGKVYAMFSKYFFKRKPNEAQIVYAQTSCLPQNARPLLDSIQSIILQIANGNLLTENHVKTYIDNKLKSLEEYESKTYKLIKLKEYVDNICNYYLNDCTDRRITSAKLVRALTVEQVRAFAKELINKGIRHEIILEGE